MAHYYGTLSGSRGSESRCGTQSSGIRAHLRTWDFGVRVELDHTLGEDIAYVFVTGGSNHPSEDRLVARLTAADLERASA